MDNVQMFTELSKLILSAMGVTVGCFFGITVFVGFCSCMPFIDNLVDYICGRYNLNLFFSVLFGFLFVTFCLCSLIFSNVFMMRYFVLEFLEWFKM